MVLRQEKGTWKPKVVEVTEDMVEAAHEKRTKTRCA